jgi:type IV secretory pathway VirB10-like protein
MRKLAAAVAIAFAALSAHSVWACEQKTDTAEQQQPKPAVAEKTQKQSKQKKAKKTEKTERVENTAVARADK